jgi:mannosyltransferase OCH1-like enzyme
MNHTPPMPIPKILHQLWRDRNVPARYLLLQESWRRLNPDWEFRLWTDRDLLELVERDYAELAPIYKGYAAKICRADLGRYLVLDRFGGVYADLDCECLKPIATILDDRSFVIGLEPDIHMAEKIVAESGVSRLVCGTFIASLPQHPFWRHIVKHIKAARAAAGPLDATGPFLLTRAYDSYAAQHTIALLPAGQLYPMTKHDCWSGRVHDIQFWEAATRDAYVLHY